jgi:hypothetical protein
LPLTPHTLPGFTPVDGLHTFPQWLPILAFLFCIHRAQAPAIKRQSSYRTTNRTSLPTPLQLLEHQKQGVIWIPSDNLPALQRFTVSLFTTQRPPSKKN